MTQEQSAENNGFKGLPKKRLIQPTEPADHPASLFTCTSGIARRIILSVGVKVRDSESIDRALRRFKRAVNRSRILRIYRANMAFTKPSEERRIAREKSHRMSRKHSRRH